MKPSTILQEKLEKYKSDDIFDYRQMVSDFSEEELQKLILLDSKSLRLISNAYSHFNPLFFEHHLKLRQFKLVFNHFDLEKEKPISIFKKLKGYKKNMFLLVNQYSTLKKDLNENDDDAFFMTNLLSIFYLNSPSNLHNHLKETLKIDEKKFYKRVENLIELISSDPKIFNFSYDKILPDLLNIMPESKEKEILDFVLNPVVKSKSALLINSTSLKKLSHSQVDLKMLMEIFTIHFEKQYIHQKKSEDAWENFLLMNQYLEKKIDCLISNDKQIHIIVDKDLEKKFIEVYKNFVTMINQEGFKSPLSAHIDAFKIKTEEFFMLQSLNLDDNIKKRPKL